MTPDFYDLLYNGYTGEYQLMSSLYRNGLDAVRPPADMGIDVVSLNLKDQLENPDHAPETFFFQVKTAVTSIEKSDGHPGVLVTVAFKLKPSEVDLLCADASRALMCYVYNQQSDALTNAYESPFICFWIDGARLAAIRGTALFQRPGDSKLTLACQLRRPVHEGGHWYAVIVDERGHQVPEGYLGTVDSENESTQASDGADHYSVRGYLDYARGKRGQAGRTPQAAPAAPKEPLEPEDAFRA